MRNNDHKILEQIVNLNKMDIYDSTLKDLRDLADKRDANKIDFQTYFNEKHRLEEHASYMGWDLNIPSRQIHRDIFVALSKDHIEPPNVGVYKKEPYDGIYKRKKTIRKPNSKRCSCKKK
jgi:hypothetical protein